MRILLVDDEQLAIDRMRALLEGVEGAECVGQARSGDEALPMIAALKPDLVILDIQMPGRSGLRTAAEIAAEPRPELVFATAHEHFAPDAFEVDAADYILKPVRFERLRLAVERARRRRQLRLDAARAGTLVAENEALAARVAAPGDDPEIWVPERHGQRRVPIEAIDWIEAARDYVMLHTATRSHLLRATMAALEEKLAGSALVRVHRSAFVRPARVVEVRRDARATSLLLADGTAVLVGPSYLRAVEQALGL